MDLELTIINIINYSGEARSLCMEAIGYAKDGESEKAKKSIEEANNKLSEAHKNQTLLIQEEARGETKSISLLLIHAQDHLMNAITVRDMATEFVELYQVIHSLKEEKHHG
ncbi:PTS lactose/cellobiose transporter subunit IIA [Natronincola ferrireducens]|uniref:PTS system, cellobiose-specific IIA component n=1 Tax=Natronincola ferrireducens TaxID=393762 RepID=A0A1G8Z7P4_9FIRM|nr:PTS lactose/cellobiose transporter subunit IIA [Natronincola ferrireducens]SDK10230.1 PTS system, cellobiose-specific IIA component [Natronincola ferrireducens]